eukprot:CAMPEP_0113552464 /NCGR_PEP_ID=MMETSP0015_2-20120614/15081_1 /TAXON_ID=2838 /ORGANISM="Odontella" /LENGTH=395 /DNA_ID=CAMNT_0000453443 /DNA_START=342 /DNA_END=1529 /DNA_ORIENTATION=+ /assembly_acc=CAM_ASM_000160
MPSCRKRDDSFDVALTVAATPEAAADAESAKPGLDFNASSAAKATGAARIKNFIRGMPKVELHLHIEGTLMPELQIRLAERNGLLSTLRYKTVEELDRAYNFTDLASFLELYYDGCSVFCTEEDFYDLTMAYLTKAHGDNVRHVEISFDPQAHTSRGVPLGTVAKGICRALEEGGSRFGITSRLVMSFLRNLPVDDAMKTLEEALSPPHRLHLERKIHAVGLDSNEMGNPPEKFRDVFDRARREGLLAVAHAGEEGPPSYIWGALDALGVNRIDHGIRCLEDPELVRRLVKDRVPLTVCPMSNVRLKVFQNMRDHPLREMLNRGLCVTVNSDDPAYFGGFMNDNYLETQRALGLSCSDIIQLARNGIDATFLAEHKKDHLRSELDRYADSHFFCQ